jgi:L-malate glycosyltransferase
VEAMACAKPVLVSNLGGARELFEEGVTALGHPAGDPVVLARNMERLAADEALRSELGRQARSAVCERFEPRAIASAVWNTYNLAVARQAQPLPAAV